jgi:PhoPQ-activated pathogenicity-related protein
LVTSKWKSAMTAPSNCMPLAVPMVVGLNDFHTIVSQIFVAMNNEIALPKP